MDNAVWSLLYVWVSSAMIFKCFPFLAHYTLQNISDNDFCSDKLILNWVLRLIFK